MDVKINATAFKNMPPAPEYSFLFSFEKNFEPEIELQWIRTHWVHSIYWCLAYILLMFCGKSLMAKREPFKLRGPLFVWNFALCVFSVIGTTRAVPELVHVLQYFGLHYSICDVSVLRENRIVSQWALLFTYSKLIELGDTLFIVLRKQRLMFLHYYHHVSVFIFSWWSFSHPFGPARWYYAMNFLVHSLMYAYYAARSLSIRPPKLVAMLITILQIVQMMIGVFVTFYAHLNIGKNCPDVYPSVTISGLLMYGSYVVLFVQYFLNVYFKREKKRSCQTDRMLANDANGIEDKKIK